MATPFSHAHVSHISRMGRRRSQSVTISRPMTEKRDSLGQSIRRKQHARTARGKSAEHHQHLSSDEGQEEEQKGKREKFRPPTVTRITRPTTGLSSSNEQATSTGLVTMSIKNQTSSTYVTSSEVHLTNSGHGTGNESSDSFSQPLATSSSNLIKQKGLFDQEFSAKNSKDHARMNDTKSNGSIKIGGREKAYDVESKNTSGTSSAGFLAAIIAIIIGVIAFIFGLTALILVLLLRSSVATSLSALNSNSSSSLSSSSSGSGTLPSVCSNSSYQSINDAGRHVHAPGMALGCDNTWPFTNRTNPLWIRFEGPGGTMLPLTTPGMNVCGSEGTGWYDGAMPTSSGSIVNGTACFTWYTSVCRFSVSISVAHCGSYYVYLLPPAPACMSRYCTI